MCTDVTHIRHVIVLINWLSYDLRLMLQGILPRMLLDVLAGWRGRRRQLSLDVRQRGRRVHGHVREHQPLAVIVLAQYFILAQIEPVADAKSAKQKKKQNSRQPLIRSV